MARQSNVLGNSPFFSKLADYYALVPSAVLIRTAEAELLRTLPVEPPALDLCCGDGFFASLIHPSGFEAGCDFNETALCRATARNAHKKLVCADITQAIPFPDGHFNTVVSNSSLEHVQNIDSVLQETARVLRPGGKLYTTFASYYAYEWWPNGQQALDHYMNYQPVYNWFPLDEWQRRMNSAGLRIIDHQYYLSKRASRIFLFLDYHLSRIYLTSDPTLASPLVSRMRQNPTQGWGATWRRLFTTASTKLFAAIWKGSFARVTIRTGDEGGGILITAERVA